MRRFDLNYQYFIIVSYIAVINVTRKLIIKRLDRSLNRYSSEDGEYERNEFRTAMEEAPKIMEFLANHLWLIINKDSLRR